MYEYRATIARWVDADTILVDIDLGFFCARQERIRLARIDAWEMNDDSAYRRRWAKSAAFRAGKLFPEGSSIIIQTKKNPRQDMYARYIAEVICDGKNVSDELLSLKGVDVYEK